MKIRKIYLSGPIEFAKGDSLNWRYDIRQRFELSQLVIPQKFECIIPQEHEEQVKIKKQHDLKWLKSYQPNLYIKILRKFIEIDIKLVNEADIVVAKWDGEISPGTFHEVGHAYLQNKPCYLVTSVPFYEIPGWFGACFTKIFPSVKELCRYLDKH